MRQILCAVVGAVVVAAAVGYALQAAVPEDQMEKVKAALPEKAPAKPQKPRKLLVFTLCTGFPHSSIEIAAESLRLMGEKTGAWTTVISNDPAIFTPEALKEFDAICFDNTTGSLFAEDAKKAALMDFVKGGKGVIGIHAATDCFYEWAEFGEMMGGYFDGHPWAEKVSVKLDDPKSPLTAAFEGKGFIVDDEIYQFKAPYSREALHVLLSLDMTYTRAPSDDYKNKDCAVAWIREFGKGRVFYCSLGHREEIFWNPKVLAFYLAGVQYAMGDLAADATPSAKLKVEPAPGPSLEETKP